MKTIQKEKKKDSTINKTFDDLFAEDDTSAAQKSKTEDFLPWWTEYVLMILGAIVLLIIYRYFKWRNEELKKRKEKENQKKQKKGTFQKELENTKVKPKRESTDKYKQAEMAAKNNKENKKNEESNFEKNKEEISKLIDKKQAQESKKIKQENKKNDKKLPAKLQLALHLAHEQQQIKNSNLSDIENIDLPQDKDKLNEVAKKLGIEKGSLETKKAIEDIEKDPEQLTKLAEKFSLFKGKK